MELRLLRYSGDSDVTLGVLFEASSKSILCYTLEDAEREVKVYGETCIPTGRFRILLATTGKNHEKYSRRFPDIHQGMLRLQDVPNYTGIDIHPGNRARDTEGCIMPGESTDLNAAGEGQVLESVKAYLKIYPLILAPILNEEEVWIEVTHRW